MDAKAIWDALTAAQRGCMARLMKWRGESLNIDTAHEELKALGLVEIRGDLFVRITPLGRAVYEDGNGIEPSSDFWERVNNYKDPAAQRWLDFQEAQAKITALQAEAARLTRERDDARAALKPFAQVWATMDRPTPGREQERIIVALNMVEIAISELNILLPMEENKVGSDLWKLMIASKNLHEKYLKDGKGANDDNVY